MAIILYYIYYIYIIYKALKALQLLSYKMMTCLLNRDSSDFWLINSLFSKTSKKSGH